MVIPEISFPLPQGNISFFWIQHQAVTQLPSERGDKFSFPSSQMADRSPGACHLQHPARFIHGGGASAPENG